MALQLSTTAELLLNQTNIKQQVILEIDGINAIFGAVEVMEIVRIGNDLEIGDFIIGGLTTAANSFDYIDLGGTSTNIRQQIEIDRGGAGSVSKFVITLIDKNQELSKLFQPGNIVDDMLARDCDVYLGFEGGSHPEDSVRIFNGSIDSIEFGAGNCKLSVAHPEQKKRQEIFTQSQTRLVGAINDIDTSITLESTSGLVIPTDIQRSFIRIDDELIEYTGTSGSALTGVSRGAFGTTASSHADEAGVDSVYIFTGDPIDIALKLMVSGGQEFYSSGTSVPSFVQLSGTENIANTFLVEDFNFQDDIGLVNGDTVTITGATEAANNVTDAIVVGVQIVSTGTAITLSGVSLVSETSSNATVSFKSQYATLNDGGALLPREVDIERHEEISDLLSAQFPDYELLAEDSIDLKDFIANEVFFPSGLYQVPRKGRISVAATIPPLTTAGTKNLDADTVTNATSLSPVRTLNKYFYNTIVYRYNRDPIADKFTTGAVTTSERSINRIPIGSRSLTIDSNGLRDNAATSQFITIQSRRWTDRFQFAAEQLQVEVKYQTGFTIEVGDTVTGVTGLSVTDVTRGDRNFESRTWEVINKDLNIRDGRVRLTVLDTKFGSDGRVGVISPSSNTDSGSTTTTLVIKTSFGFDGIERDKWSSYVGEKIRVHSQDYSFDEEVTIQELPVNNQAQIIVNPALSVAPPEDYIIDVPVYPDTTNTLDNAAYKDQFCFWDPQVTIISGTTTTFVVGAGDISKFFVGGFVRVHNEDFSNDSIVLTTDDDLEITDVDTGTNTITVNRDIGFTPVAGDLVDLIGFADMGLPYRIF